MHQHNHDHDHHHAHSPDLSPLQAELLSHTPFSVSAAALGLIVAGLICFMAPTSPGGVHDAEHGGNEPMMNLFHLFHPAHVLFSAAATTAMFWRYERKAFKAIIVGLVGSIGVCGLSDIGFPQLSLMIMGKHTPLHICVIHHPDLVLPFAAVGVLVGLGASSTVMHSTLFSHSLHVMASTMASIFYMIVPFGRLEWFDDIGRIFIFLIIGVTIPCCSSDIIFPLLMVKGAKEKAVSA